MLNLNVLSELLNEQPIIKGNQAYFTCPGCNTPKENEKFSINIHNNKYGCFKCDTSIQAIKELLKGKTYKNNIRTSTPENETINHLIPEKKKREILTDLFHLLELSSDHKKAFELKRGFTAPDNYLSFNENCIPKLLKKYSEKELIQVDILRSWNGKKTPNHLRNRLVIFHKDQFGNICYYRTYSFTDTERKKQAPRKEHGLNLIPYNLQLINNNSVIVITEGEEKSDIGNYLLSDIGFISLPGIGIHKILEPYLNLLKEKTIIILFDKKKETKLNEEKEAVKLAKKLIENDINVFISELPTPENEQENDLDSWLKNFETIEQKREALREVVENRCNLNEYKSKYFQDTFKRDKPKMYYKLPGKTINKISLEQGRKILKESIENHVLNGKGKTLIVKAPPGVGKTYSIIEALKDKDYIHVVPDKNLRQEIKEVSSSNEILGLLDHCSITLSANKTVNPKKILNELTEIGNKGLPTQNYCYSCSYSKNDDNYPDRITCSRFKKHSGKITMTFAKYINSGNLYKDYEYIVFDEDIKNALIQTNYLNLTDIENIQRFYNSNELDLILQILKEIIQSNNNKTLTGFDIRAIIHKKFRNSLRISLRDTLKNLSFDSLAEKKETIKQLINNKNIDQLPNKKALKGLIQVIKKSFDNIQLLPGKGFEFKHVLDLDLRGKTSFYLNATEDTELIKEYGFTQENSVILDLTNIHIPGIKLNLMPDRTFLAGNFKEAPEKIIHIAKYINEKSENEKSLLIAPNEIINLISIHLNHNISTLSYGKHKGRNDFKDYKKTFVLPNKIDFSDIIKESKVIFGNLSDNDLVYNEKESGYIDKSTGKELFFTQLGFKEKKLQMLLEQKREAEIIQALFRIKRNEQEKEFYIFGNISLKKYGLAPDNILSSNEIFNPGRVKTFYKIDEFNKIKSIILDILKEHKFITLSELKYALFLKINHPETLIQSMLVDFYYNIYISITQNDKHSCSNVFSRRFKKIIDHVIHENNFITEDFSTIKNTKEKIILPDINLLDDAKEFYKDLLFSEKTDNALLLPKIITDFINDCGTVVDDIDSKKVMVNMTYSKIYNRSDDKFTFETFIDENAIDLVNYYDSYRDKLLNRENPLDDNFLDDLDTWIKKSAENTPGRYKKEFVIYSLGQEINEINEIIKERNKSDVVPPAPAEINIIESFTYKKVFKDFDKHKQFIFKARLEIISKSVKDRRVIKYLYYLENKINHDCLSSLDNWTLSNLKTVPGILLNPPLENAGYFEANLIKDFLEVINADNVEILVKRSNFDTKKYVFTNDPHWLDGIDEKAIYKYISTIDPIKIELDNIQIKISKMFNISSEKAGFYLSNYPYANNIHEINQNDYNGFNFA